MRGGFAAVFYNKIPSRSFSTSLIPPPPPSVSKSDGPSSQRFLGPT